MARITANGIAIEYRIDGPVRGVPLLAIMGLGAQLIRWPPALIGALVSSGFRVIRYDNRDAGLSEMFEEAGIPDLRAVAQALSEGNAPALPYRLVDMAADAVGLLDALDIAHAHLVGVSMGGMIAQLVAATCPQRALSLTSIMSSTGNPQMPPPTAAALAALTARGPDPRRDIEGYLRHAVRASQAIGSPAYPADAAAIRAQFLNEFRRSYAPGGFARQYAAAIAAPDRRPLLRTVTMPTLVVHGAADPLVDPACGRDTAEAIPGAELRIVPGMGHDLPSEVHGDIVAAIQRAVALSQSVIEFYRPVDNNTGKSPMEHHNASLPDPRKDGRRLPGPSCHSQS